MRRILVVVAATLFVLSAMTGPVLAMQPAGGPAQEHFGCVDGEQSAVGGHPGAAGLVDATPKVGDLTDDELPTAWNAVERADPIELGDC